MAEVGKENGCPNKGCKCEQGKQDGQSVRCQWGKSVASAAIKEMHPQPVDVEEPKPTVDDSEVKAFLEECEKAGENVLDVVGHIAAREGIDLSDDQPKDEAKSRIWAFLRGVLKSWVLDLATFAVQELVSGNFDWKSFIQDYVQGHLGRENEKLGPEVPVDNNRREQSATEATVRVLRVLPCVIRRYVFVR